MKASRVVITGGPCSGKTSLIDAISEQKQINEVLWADYNLIPEIARPILQFMREYEPEKLEGEYLQEVIETLQLKSWVDNKEAIFDRGLPDQIAYRQFLDLSLPLHVINRCNKYRYDKVFYLPYWPEIYKSDEVRKETPEEAKAISWLIKSAYNICGYKVIDLPKVSIIDRVTFIYDNIT